MAKAATAAKPKAAAPTGPALKLVEVMPGNAKVALAGLEAGKSTTHMIAPAKLRVIPGFNVRVHDNKSYADELVALKNSIMSEGFYQSKPISGYVGKDGEEDVVFVTDGHRRLEAVRAAIAEGAEIASLPVVLKPSGVSMVDLTVALVKENTGRRLSMLENAIVVKRLLSNGLTEDDIASRLDFTKRGVSDFLVLISAPKSIRRAVMDEKITGTEAVRICRKFSKEPKKAEETIAAMLEKAAARGKEKATRKDSGDAPIKAKAEKAEGTNAEGVKVRMAKVETTWAVSKGQSFDLKEIRYFKNLFGDNDWFTPDEAKAGFAVAVEDVEFKATIKRPKKDEPAPAPEEEAAVEAGEDEAAALSGDEPPTEEAGEEEAGEL